MGKTFLSVKNKNYKYIVTKFVLDSVLHHVGLSWIIERNQKFQYDIYEHNVDWLRNCPWYNTPICKNYMEQCLKNILEMQELTDIILFVIFMHMIKNRHHMLMTLAAVMVTKYRQIWQYKHYIH